MLCVYASLVLYIGHWLSPGVMLVNKTEVHVLTADWLLMIIAAQQHGLWSSARGDAVQTGLGGLPLVPCAATACFAS